MLSLTRDPQGDEAAYLAALNQCFPGWGDERFFAWCFARPCGGPVARRVLVHEDGELLAGSAVAFRTLVSRGRAVPAGIMTGSWTLPAARGKGCFTAVIEESVAIARDSGAAVLLAFVTEDNASYRRLAKAGSALFPTWYLVEPAGRTASSPAPAAARDEAIDAVFAARTSAGPTRFGYTRPEWVGQIVERVRKVELLRVGGGFAVVEEKGDFLRVESWVSPDPDAMFAGLAAHAHHRGRRVFSFTTDAAVRDAAARTGIEAKPGFLTALSADGRFDVSELAAWDLHSGDRM